MKNDEKVQEARVSFLFFSVEKRWAVGGMFRDVTTSWRGPAAKCSGGGRGITYGRIC